MKDFQDRYSSKFRRATRTAVDCPDSEALAMLAAGRAWPWQRRQLVDHLGRCSDCADDYRVLVAARGGLVTALEAHADDAGGFAPAWLRPGLAAAALALVTALGVSVLVQTSGPGSLSEPNVIVANDFEPRQRRQAVPEPAEDRVFKSGFGEPEPADGLLFRDDFGG